MSLLRSLGGLGTRNLQNILLVQYPNLVQNYHYSSAASILAVSIAVKVRVAVFENMDSSVTGNIPTFALFRQDFEINDSLRQMNQRR